MDVQIFDHDDRDNSILYKFARAGQQKAIAAVDFSVFRRAQIFETSFSTESVNKRPSVGWSIAWRRWSTHLPDVVSCDGNAWSLTWQYAVRHRPRHPCLRVRPVGPGPAQGRAQAPALGENQRDQSQH
jgi:hypothetical protein